jgi:hypothetical protein
LKKTGKRTLWLIVDPIAMAGPKVQNVEVSGNGTAGFTRLNCIAEDQSRRWQLN